MEQRWGFTQCNHYLLLCWTPMAGLNLSNYAGQCFPFLWCLIGDWNEDIRGGVARLSSHPLLWRLSIPVLLHCRHHVMVILGIHSSLCPDQAPLCLLWIQSHLLWQLRTFHNHMSEHLIKSASHIRTLVLEMPLLFTDPAAFIWISWWAKFPLLWCFALHLTFFLNCVSWLILNPTFPVLSTGAEVAFLGF